MAAPMRLLFPKIHHLSVSVQRLTSRGIYSRTISSVNKSESQSQMLVPYFRQLEFVASAASLKRWMTTGLTGDMLRKEMDKLTDRFMEAKELLDDARESMGSVYFNEDLQDADQAVEETLTEYQRLLSELDDGQRQTVTRSIGLKMEELSAQQIMIRESLKD